MDEQNRERLMQELAQGIARHIRRTLGATARLPRNNDTHRVVHEHFTELLRQSGVQLTEAQTKELFGRISEDLFDPLPPSN